MPVAPCGRLPLALLLLLGGAVSAATAAGALKEEDKCSANKSTSNCKDGVIIPLWHPYESHEISLGDRIGRALIYFCAIAYMFLGVSIVADRFMASIEVITSKEREIRVTKPTGETITLKVRIWNETVSNLTLMALGSSAPEILLSIIEVAGHNFKAGDLGPNTIVGSAAFNLFMIIALCVWVIPSTEVRRQKHPAVFFVTAAWSLFAYAWLFLIVAVISEGVIDIWEGVVTFLFFPLTVLTAYIADRKLLVTRFLPKRYRRTSRGGLVATEHGEVEMAAVDGVVDGHKLLHQASVDPAVRAFEEHRREFIELMKEIRKRNPTIDPDALQKQAEYEMINRGPKSRAFYRVQATRRLTGGGDMVKKKLDKEHHKSMEVLAAAEDFKQRHTCRVFFEPAHYTVLENVGAFDAIVSREGGPDGLTVTVDYHSEDGTANEGSDYVGVKGAITFLPHEHHKNISVTIIDDDVFEEDEHFYIVLDNLRVKTKDGLVLDPSRLAGVPVAELETGANVATVMILDDDHAGVFGFEHDQFAVSETDGYCRLKVQRSSGARGKVLVPYRTVDGTAKGDRDFERKTGQLAFDDDQTEAFIEIGIVDDEEYEKSENFTVELDHPIWVKKLSDQTKIQERYLRRQRRNKQQADDDSVGARPRSSSIEGLVDKFGSWLSGKKPGADKDKDSAVGVDEDREQNEDDKIADLGKPRLGELTVCTINIKESKEFQGIVDRMLKTANTSLVMGTTSWREQFVEALTVDAGDGDGDGDDDGGEKEEGDDDVPSSPSWTDYLMHFICVPWKLLFALIPPTDIWGGWACFVVSILGIGLLTAVIGDLASHFGCTIGLKDAVTAITFVALGTSVPDTFASKVAAVQDKYADSSIGNVTGSNGVNVFLGIGIAWTMAAVYHWLDDGSAFTVPVGSLAFSVTIYSIEAVVCIVVLVARRHPSLAGGELGGPMRFKLATVVLLVFLWLFYIAISSLEAYCVIKVF